MARLQLPPQNPRLNFVINDFSGGMVNNVNDTKMRDNQSPDMLNMQFRIDGLIQKRPGTVHVSTSPWGRKLIDVIPFEYEANQEKYIYQTESTEASNMLSYDCDGSPFVIWRSDNMLSDTCHMMFRGIMHLFWVDGFNIYAYNDKDKKTFKFVNPPEGFTPGAKPTTKGKYVEKFIEKYTNGEYDCSSLYELWYEPCEYELEDGYKGKNTLPSMVNLIQVKDDRLYLSGNDLDPNMVYISDIMTPAYFPASLPIQTPPTDDVITTLELYNNSLIIGRRDSIYSLTGNTNRVDNSNIYVLSKVNTHTGIANKKCSDIVYSRMFFVGTDGNFYKLNPPSVNSNTISTTQLNTLLDLTLPPFNLTRGDIKHAHTCFDGSLGLWYIQIADITLVYSYQLQAWTRYDRVDALSFFKFNGELQFCRNTGSIYRFASREGNQQYYDEFYDPDVKKIITLPVVAYWSSRNLDLGTPARVKQFRDTYITSECFEDYQTTVNIRYEVDYVDVRDSFVIKNEISKWDNAIFDESKFVSRNIDRSLPMMLNRRGRTIKVFYGCGFEYWGARNELPVPGIIPEYQMVYLIPEDKLYIRVPRQDVEGNKFEKYYRPLRDDEMNQALLVHNVMGIYELKGYR